MKGRVHWPVWASVLVPPQTYCVRCGHAVHSTVCWTQLDQARHAFGVWRAVLASVTP
jgi:hypothetical protein